MSKEQMATQPDSLVDPRGVWNWIGTVLVAVFLVAGYNYGLFLIIKASAEMHWLLGLVVTTFYTCFCCILVVLLRSRHAQESPLHLGVWISSLITCCSMAVASAASLLLLRAGWAIYEPNPPVDRAYLDLAKYYLWVLLDMLPGLQANELLTFAPPLQPKNAVAGIPVVAFRTFILFGLLAALKVWWEGRKNSNRKDRTYYGLGLIIR